MARKKGKPVSFDAMVKFFMQTYGIPTKKDVDKLMERMDRIETLIKSGAPAGARRRTVNKAATSKSPKEAGGATASDTVLDIVQRSKNGIDFSEIQKKTEYPEKKLRNIIFRLNKLKKIQRKDRGIYTAV